MREWSVGYALQGIYWVFMGCRGVIPDFLSIVVANTFLTVSYSLLYAAVREFQHRLFRYNILFLPAVATAIFISFFWAYNDNIFLRTVYISLVSGIQMWFIALILFRDVPFQIRRSQWLTGCFFAIGAILWFTRFLEVDTTPHQQPQVFGPSNVRAILLVLGFGNVVLTSIGFMLMIRERAGEVLQKAYRELQRTKDQLVQSEKIVALGHLASGAAHEIRNPLHVMNLWIQILEKTERLTEKTREAFGVINVQIARIVKIIDGLRTFSSLPTGEKKHRDINQVIDHVLRATATRIKADSVTIETSFQSDLPMISIDVKRME